MCDMKSTIEKELRKEFKELKSSMDFFSEQFDAMAKRCSKIEKENVSLKKENAALSEECSQLRKLVMNSEQRLTNLEQYSRNRNLELKGIPVVKDESLLDVLKQLEDVIQEPISEDDIDVCHLVPKKDGTCPNVVQFRTRGMHNTALEKARKTPRGQEEGSLARDRARIQLPAGVSKRDGKQLKQCWHKLKEKWRKEKAADSREVFRTGGGRPQRSEMTDQLQRVGAVASHMNVRVGNCYDSDHGRHGTDFRNNGR
ncbi:hypothetical protein V5799_024317 [Amblyomma americanum]|uniref:Uncharacterized protein n=1 Tax=Amblyomma americanum TaxID=6943 RepID=A0AAQ4ECG1_AMBAM